MAVRATVDPAIGVRPLIKAIQNHLDRKGTKDLESSLAVPDGKPWGWKRAVNPLWMISMAPLAYDLICEAKNAVLPSKKVKLAIQKLCDDKKIQTKNAKRELCDAIDNCDQMIRVLVSQFRKAKQDNECYLSLVRKMSEDEKRTLDAVLAMIDLSHPGVASETSSFEAQIVPVQASAASSSMPQPMSQDAPPQKEIFRRILSKQPSSPWNDPAHGAPPSPKEGLSSVLALAKPEEPKPCVGVKRQNAAIFEDKEGQPPHAALKRQNARIFGGMVVGQWISSSAESEEPEHQKPKTKREVSFNQYLSDGEQNALEKALSLDCPKIKKKPATKKKPAAAEVKKKPSLCPSKKPAGKNVASGGSVENKEVGKAALAKDNKAERKSSFKHRKTSSAYHSAKKEALKQGKDLEEATELARQASQKVAAQIDAGLLKE